MKFINLFVFFLIIHFSGCEFFVNEDFIARNDFEINVFKNEIVQVCQLLSLLILNFFSLNSRLLIENKDYAEMNFYILLF